jgi:cell wall assembly regulator SMI1
MMNELWAEYEKWLQTHFPEGIMALNPGAQEEEVDALESAIGVQLPADYRTCLRVHNGQKPDAVGLLWSNEFLSTSRILDEWQLMKQLLDDGHFAYPSESSPKDAIKPDWWNPRWIPVTSDGCGNLECLDLAPGAAGFVGQLIDFDHETVHRCVIALSFRDAMKSYLAEVLAGGYAYSDDYGRLMPLDEL